MTDSRESVAEPTLYPELALIHSSSSLQRESFSNQTSTYVQTDEGWLYLAAVLDPYLRNVTGWPMSATVDSRLVGDAQEMAVRQHLVAGLLVHSDRGAQYASEHFSMLVRHGLFFRMNRKVICSFR